MKKFYLLVCILLLCTFGGYAQSDYTITASAVLQDNSALDAMSLGLITPWGSNGTINITASHDTTYHFYETIRYHIYEVQLDGVSQGNVDSLVLSTISANHTITVIYYEQCKVSQLPYTQNFSSFADYSSPDCWTTLGDAPFVSSHTLLFYSGYSGYSMALLPIDSSISINSLQIDYSFEAFLGGGVFEIGISDGTTFTHIETVNLISGLANYNTYLRDYTGNGHYIAFKWSYDWGGDEGDMQFLYLHNIEINYIPDCVTPDNIIINNITPTNANVTWHSRGIGYENSWDVVCVPYGNDLSTGIITTVYDTTTTLTGLIPNTHYDVYVRANCGNVNSTWSNAVDFYTFCDPITSLPYIENFDSYETTNRTIPNCWKLSTNIGSSSVSLSSSYSYSSPASLYFYSTNSTYCIVSLPEIDPSIPINTLQINFKLRKQYVNVGSALQIGVMTDPLVDTTFALISTVSIPPTTTTATWENFEVLFNTYIGTGRYIAFKSDQGTVSNTAFLDDVSIDYLPNCIIPSNITIYNIGQTSADVTWHPRGNESSWDIAYTTYGNNPVAGIVTTVYDTITTLTGLTSNTNYDIYVRANCDNENSLWSTVEEFQTLCDAITTLPYTENF